MTLPLRFLRDAIFHSNLVVDLYRVGHGPGLSDWQLSYSLFKSFELDATQIGIRFGRGGQRPLPAGTVCTVYSLTAGTVTARTRPPPPPQ